MGFVKVLKTKAYFKRFQTKYRRRREGLTDYYARKRLIIQDKDKYNTPKYRLVARATNTRIIAQIVYATLKCDRVLCAADSYELKRFGVSTGLASYAAAYATGLLLARRLLKQIGLDTVYAGQTKVDGAYFNVDEDQKEKKPFKAILDAGLVRTTTGNRVFGVLKGACDGGINIPHSESRFPGYVRASDEGESSKYKPEDHKARIFGKHIDAYMKHLKGQSNEAFQKQFSKWSKTLEAAKVDSVEKLFTKVHAEIRKNPERVKSTKKNDKPKRDHKKFYPTKLTAAQRKDRVKTKFQLALSQ
ncbi:60S ribosomal protein L5 (macronuclear) [Tetrahymena thermophila SB210]|uniref:Large ribosomal subunit protein uL18 n=1 Tax=Tetrahymena thermophila (strain SB210) TaxID=312017 RepID=RL5_TETTS|nr:60S ribosomal protein L5 [Tetrahymena thermophila SB210]Q231U7.2 RecName: Full=Large ribosomal subunit protein uL18; AltName: Full=60S ribosomal protein L5 [Tetrahymena thermophila SB210]4V8P_BM Chain BM, 60S RIBOSOMAL PROTEIN L5 [Tetrahymena thermophila]4V8P_CM Chain CM, 60S RIBOSOMAL PROTEIN L5 [Tetrahymena thermophila]4V8P_EM Chain EM, 60S RIBOSOMAL PROTEIN L5 [Tetrahymena thermophila]4V8P_GM Chain GM, 60S RIBOSOMAL PROTEIN L5 [Tetrahymena thermophila]EAR91353.2 60S ribosomal protein L5|eukprot:XP_001011598.2 60S ribosomal protein L5 [Tetrahymena thermophila SB210]